MKRRYIFLIGLGVVGALAVAGYFVLPRFLQSGVTATSTQTAGSLGQVSTMTIVNSVEAAGSAEALQSESLSWKTTGTVAEVYVSIGDKVKKGDVLMTIDPLTAPQSVVQAQIELVNAQEKLDNLLHPSALEIANAQQAVSTAQHTLKDAQQNLKYVQNPVGQSLYNAIDDAKTALDTALANQQLERIGSDASSVKTTEDDLNLAGFGA
jgi:multidrug efflux pump subunit AcrA (membrane-fusion protein)